MKLSCQIIRDLLPLYDESLCSDESRRAVKEHLAGCSDCCRLSKQVAALDLPASKCSREDAAVAKCLKKIRRRWALSLIALVLVIPVFGLLFNWFRGEGVCFGNLDEIAAVHAFAAALEDGRFADAAMAIDHGSRHAQIRSTVENLPDGYDFSQFEELRLDGKIWMVQTAYRERYKMDRLPAADIWTMLVLQRDGGVFVPEDVWLDLAAAQPEVFQKTGDGTWLVDNGAVWHPQETPWGTYCIRENAVLNADCTAAELCCGLVLVPLAIYEEAVPQLEAMAQESRKEILDRYGEAAAMSREAFRQAASAHHAQKLLQLKHAGYDLRSTGWDACFRNDDGSWLVQWGMEITLDGTWYPMQLFCRVRPGGITLSSIGWPVETPDHGDFISLFFPDFPTNNQKITENT